MAKEKTKPEPEPKPDNTALLLEAVKKEVKERKEKCSLEIDAILKKYNCELKAEIIMSELNGVRFVKIIVPK